MRFSANLGFLWPDRPLAARIRSAAQAGFDAVEMHFPYSESLDEVRAALRETGLPLLSLNTRPGDVAAGEFGLAALAGQETRARAAIDEALDWAAALGAGGVHVMAGKGGDEATFLANLVYALDRAQTLGIAVLIEPINPRDAPGYFLASLEQAAAYVRSLGPGSRILFDCYHLQILGGDLLRRFDLHRDLVGHVQFAAVPDRGEPDRGEVNYGWLLPEMAAAGYEGAFGAEYRPRGLTEAGLGWLGPLKGVAPAPRPHSGVAAPRSDP